MAFVVYPWRFIAHNHHAGQVSWGSQGVVLCTGDAAARHRPIAFTYACSDGYTAISRLPEPRLFFSRMYRMQFRLAWSEELGFAPLHPSLILLQ